MKFSSLLLSISLILSLYSCIPNKELVYLQDKNKKSTTAVPIKEYNSQIAAYQVQHGDVLNIKVLSQDPMSVQPFNLDGQSNNVQMQLNLPQLFITGYTVDEKGNIQFPLLGDIMVRGKTIAEITSLLTEKIDKYVNNASVKVKLVSFKVTVLGEVKTPGVHFIYNDRANILEVLGFAGDLTDLGNRHRVKLIRTLENKQIQVINLDLTDRALIESKHFYLVPNDVIYVEPMKAKNFRLNLPTINLIVSSITTLLVIINLVAK